MTKDELNARIDAEILTGVAPKVIAEKYDVSLATISNRGKALNSVEVDGSLTDNNITKATLKIIRDKIAAEAPKAAKTADAIIDGLEGLKILNQDIQDGLSKVVKLTNDMLDGDLDENRNLVPISKRDLQILAGILTSVYNTINAKGTTINMTNTKVTSQGENLSFFKATLKDV